MTGLDEPTSEEDKPAALRSAAVEALQRAARQNDPKEFDRLTRYALALIERARTIGHGLGGPTSEANDAAVPSEQEKEEPRYSRKLTAKLIAALWRLCSWRTER